MSALHGLSPRLSVGVDIVDAERLRSVVTRWGDRVLERLFTTAERERLYGARGLRWDSLAGRFAAKEAARKAFGARGEMPRWTDLQLDVGVHGEPSLTLLGDAPGAARRCGFRQFHVSIAHERRSAVAIVVAL